MYIGGNSFFGNNIAFPAGGRVGDNCLIATKAMIPLDGEIREGVGLLGSPSFEIPRTVERDLAFDHLSEGDELRRRLRAKNWHNLRTMGIFLLGRWLHVFLVTVFALAAFDSYGGFAQLEMAAPVRGQRPGHAGLLRAARARHEALAPAGAEVLLDL